MRLPNPPLTIFAVAMLAGCAGTPPGRLAATGDVAVLEVVLPADLAYRRIVEGARNCYERDFDVASDYFPGTGGGRVSVSMRTAFTMSTALVADISSSGSGAVVRLATHPSATAMRSNVSAWLETGTYTACSLT